MPFEIVMPRLGWTMERGSLAGWLKQDGEHVEAGELLFRVEGDKAIQEIEALASGTLRIPRASPPAGLEVPVGTLLAYILQPGESLPDSPQSDRRFTHTQPAAQVAESPTAGAASHAGQGGSVPIRGVRNRASPRARRVAGELGVDWSVLQGSGRSGRIVERDVRRAGKAGRHMESVAAPVTITTEADATELVRLRDQIKDDGPQAVPSYVDLFARLVAAALAEHPVLAARFAGDVMRPPAEADTGIAIVNLGMYEIDAFTPILGSAGRPVLGIGRIAPKPVVVEGAPDRIAIRHMVFLSLTIDQRLVDGAPAAGFLQRVKQYVEKPYLWLAGQACACNS